MQHDRYARFLGSWLPLLEQTEPTSVSHSTRAPPILVPLLPFLNLRRPLSLWCGLAASKLVALGCQCLHSECKLAN